MNKRTRLSFAMLVLTGAVPSFAEVSDERVSALEARLAQVEAAAAAKTEAAQREAEKLKINGFASAGFGYLTAEEHVYAGLRDAWTHSSEAIVGVQLDARVNPKMNAVIQLVGRGAEDFDVGAEWAYITYRPVPDGEFRIGRQRFAFFMMSEYLEVGYSYPWARPPIEVYLEGMPQAYNGLSYNHTVTSGAWSHDVQFSWGSTDFPVSGGTFVLQDATGANVRSTAGNWTFNVNYSRSNGSFSNELFDGLAMAGMLNPVKDDVAWFGGIGLQYDNGRFFAMAEMDQINVHGFFPDSQEHYLTAGWRFGKFTPHLTWARHETIDPEQRMPDPMLSMLCGPTPICLPDGASGSMDGFPDPLPADTLNRLLDSPQTSATFGIRYDFLANAAIKVDWTRVLDRDGTFGNFGRVDDNLFYGAQPPDDVDLYRVVVDVVF